MKARSHSLSVTDSPYSKRQANVELVAAALDKPESRDSSFRDLCLKRDSYRCVVTGDYDTGYWERQGYSDVSHGPVEAAHIIPFSYSSWDKSSVTKPHF